MARPRHAMRVHPLRTKGVIVGVPVAAAVAFGAHTVLGITPVSDQQHDTQTASSAPGVARSGAPVQSYGLATAPPPTTLGLLSAPAVEHGSSPHDAATPTGSSSGPHLTAGAARSVPIAAPPAAPSSMLTFSPAAAPAAAAPAAAVPAAVAPAAAPAARRPGGPAGRAAHRSPGGVDRRHAGRRGLVEQRVVGGLAARPGPRRREGLGALLRGLIDTTVGGPG